MKKVCRLYSAGQIIKEIHITDNEESPPDVIISKNGVIFYNTESEMKKSKDTLFLTYLIATVKKLED